ncbi:MAG TPA: ABC transporter ATP-binding protein/permease [Bacilli bacterium]|nr:ABC transporter ATP-binding protein/permease [Bacilli bacterium]
MLKISNLNKYFNKGKKNELHVINNTSITLEDNGLVALLGPSGCGKTTLLNCIGGLDKANKGTIYLNNKKINSKLASRVDELRNLNVGYIFQDYKLIDNMSVYDNIALVLTMIGLKDKKEIKKRVEYVLDKVGMLRYKKRPAGMLSGGERQRVGIARAIVKDPNIILADEPTGNLDSKNSLEIMKIIKAISKDKLVILVTHEQSLAKFYASRIIEIQDGQVIKDYENDNVDSLDYEIDNTFYLKDLELDNISKKDNNINIYTDESSGKIKLDIVVKKGNIYIRSNTNDKIEVVDENSSIEMIDEHYKKIEQADIDKYQFNFKDIINDNYKKKYSSIFNPISLITNGFRKIFNFPILKKILLIGFVLSGMFVLYSTSTITATLTIKDKDFVEYNKNYLTISMKKVKIDEFISYEKEKNINYILPGDSSVNFFIKYNYLYQTDKLNDVLSGSLSSLDMISKEDLICGTMPTNAQEIVVDKLAIEGMFSVNPNAAMIGITDYKELLNKEAIIANMDNFKIVGITDLGSPSIYTDNSQFINIISNNKDDMESESTNLIDYKLYENKNGVTLKEGRAPVNDFEVVVGIQNKDSMPINKQINKTINGTKLTVVGYYDSVYNDEYYFVSNNTIRYNTILTKEDITVYSSDKENTLNDFRNKNLNINDSYEKSKKDYMNEARDSINASLLVSFIILGISLVEIFLMIRASFLSRIKEVGILRAIGVKKLDIYNMFFGEIFAMTTVACVPGIIFMAYILNTLTGIKQLARMFTINPFVIIVSIILVYVFNLIVGLIPVFNTIRKTPANILARHDLD